jgi:L-2,4-diaminobutyrate decarboxylase
VRRPDWSPDEDAAWGADALACGVAMLMPTRHAGETVLRFCFVNPQTTRDDVDMVIGDLAAAGGGPAQLTAPPAPSPSPP